MLGIDPKVARATWTVFLISLAILLAFLARHTLVIFTLAVFFAYMLSPVVNFIQRFIPPRVSRNVTLLIVYVLFIAAIGGIGFAIGSAIAEQATALATKLPEMIKNKDPLEAMPLPGWLDPLRTRIVGAIRTQVENLDKEAFPLIKTALTELAARSGRVLEFILVPILAFFFLKDGREIKETIINWTTQGRNSVVLEGIFDDLHTLLLHYIRALVTLSSATFVVYTLFLQITGGQFPLLLGGVAAVLEFIPVVGPLTASVSIIIVEGVTGYNHLLAVIVFLVVYRLFQDYVLTPYLMGSGIELHPLLVLFGVLAGEQIGGIPGMFFSVPIIASLRVVYVRLQRERVHKEVMVREE